MFKLKVIRYWLNNKFRQKFECREDIEKYQNKKLKLFVESTLIKSAFYKKFFDKGVFNWDVIPVISKAEFMEHFDEINTVGIKKEQAMQVAIEAEVNRDFKSVLNEITVGLSTGTSGVRGLFLVSEKERAQWAAIVMSKIIKPQLFKKKKVAFFLRANSNLYTSVQSSLIEFKYFDIFQPIEKLLDELNLFQPDIVAAQPSILMEIAAAHRKKIISVVPEQIISFAEVLHGDDKEIIRKQFPCRFTEVYQCTEGLLGISCEHGTMHLNEEFIKFEKDVIDENLFYPIITDFSRTSQPVVKYKLNDVLLEKTEPCKCGSKMLAIEKIIGRDDDVLEFIGTNEIIKLYPDLISRRIALATETYFKYQIKQKNHQLLEIFSDIEEEEFNYFKELMLSQLNILLTERGVSDVQFIFNNYIEQIQGNKNRRISKEFV